MLPKSAVIGTIDRDILKITTRQTPRVSQNQFILIMHGLQDDENIQELSQCQEVTKKTIQMFLIKHQNAAKLHVFINKG